MATRTGRLVVDPRTGKMVEEYKEDQMAVALFDPECAKPGTTSSASCCAPTSPCTSQLLQLRIVSMTSQLCMLVAIAA